MSPSLSDSDHTQAIFHIHRLFFFLFVCFFLTAVHGDAPLPAVEPNRGEKSEGERRLTGWLAGDKTSGVGGKKRRKEGGRSGAGMTISAGDIDQGAKCGQR